MKIPTGPFPAIIDKDGKYLGNMMPSPEVLRYLAARPKRRKFTDWLCDPNDERIVEVKSPRTGITYRSEVVKTEDGIKFVPIPLRPVAVVGFDADLTEQERFQDYLSMPER